MSSAFPKGQQNEDRKRRRHFIDRRDTKLRNGVPNVASFLYDQLFLHFVYAQLGFHLIRNILTTDQKPTMAHFNHAVCNVINY